MTRRGGCDLETLQLLFLCYKSSSDHSFVDLIEIVQARLDALDSGVSSNGDQRASWYVAKAMCAENDFADLIPRPLVDTRSFELAFASAESDDVRFWVLHEHAARLASLGREEDLDALLASAGQGFSKPEQVGKFEACREVCADLLATVRKRSDIEEVDRLRTTMALMEDRLRRAQERDDISGIDRYTARVNAAQAAFDEALSEFKSVYPEDKTFD